MRVIWSGPALTELASIREYIAENNPLTAEKFTQEIYKKVSSLLEEFPRYGRKIPELDKDEFREIIHGNYRIMYRITADELRIVAVRNSKQLFTEEG
ncbi:MAG: type II toxin-antitoxin system RelE/ParE family toxin [Candidatus Kapaibacterium sp.]